VRGWLVFLGWLVGWLVLRLWCRRHPLPRELEPVLPRLEPEARAAITRNQRERAR
jgi:hypothetical protein